MSNQATQGSTGCGPSTAHTTCTGTAMDHFLASNEDPINAQLVGSAGTVNSVPHTTQRASQQIQNVSTMVPSNSFANHVNRSAGH